jgi:hypothetical protein
VFTANDQRKYVFRSEHKNKKKQWVRYLNDAAKGACLYTRFFIIRILIYIFFDFLLLFFGPK